MTLSFFNAPGEEFRYVWGDNTSWSIAKPSSLNCMRIVCVPLVEK
jgi:hypothetical protein